MKSISYTVTHYDGGATIVLQIGDKQRALDEIPPELSQADDAFKQFAREYKTPIEKAQEEIVQDFIKTATYDELLAKSDLFAEWQDGKSYSAGEIIKRGSELYRVEQDHEAEQYRPPGSIATVYRTMNKAQEVLPFQDGVTYYKGEKYFDDKDAVWECTAETGTVHSAIELPTAWRKVSTVATGGRT